MREVRRVGARSAADRQTFVRLLLEVVLAKDRLKDRRARAYLEDMQGARDWTRGAGTTRSHDSSAKRIQALTRRATPMLAACGAPMTALGVSPDASNADVKKAYRRLMNKNHPDKISSSNPGDEVLAEAERRTREVRSAYEMLKARRSIR